MHTQFKTTILLLLVAAALSTIGCGKARLVYHQFPAEVTTVEHLPESAVVYGEEPHQRLAEGELYEGFVVSSYRAWWGMPRARLGSSTNQCRIAHVSGRKYKRWKTVLCFDRRDIDRGQLGGVKDGWFEYVFTDHHERMHVYQWRDARTTYNISRYWRWQPRWEVFHTNREYFVLQ